MIDNKGIRSLLPPFQTNDEIAAQEASKAAVEAFTKSLAQEVASRGITANTIAPGFIQTDMTAKLSDAQKQAIMKSVPMQRMGTTHEVAHAVKFLLADQAGYITGTCIHVNGGLVML